MTSMASQERAVSAILAPYPHELATTLIPSEPIDPLDNVYVLFNM